MIHPRNGGRLAAMLVCGLMAATSAQSLELQPADAVLARLAQRDAVEASRTASPAAALMKDIAAYRSRSSQLAPPQAAAEWLSLWDRALAMGQQGTPGDLDAYDTATRNQVGPASLLASLPAPEAWPALRAEGVQRAAKAPANARALGLRLLGEVLTRDVAAARQSLAAFERLAAAAAPDEREPRLMIASDMKALLYQLYGTREEIAAAFSATVDTHARQSYPIDVTVPDLVGLLGAAKAEALLLDALKKPVSLWVPEGEATKALARRLALREVNRLRRAQWALIDGMGTAPLYEAMRVRFDPRTTPGAGAPAEDADPANRYERRQADLYYFLDLVIAKRHAEAERAMLRATSGRGDELSPRGRPWPNWRGVARTPPCMPTCPSCSHAGPRHPRGTSS